MTLLAPMAALWAGVLSLPVLVALYLLKLRRRPVRVSTTRFWPAAGRDAQANVPLAWLRPSWLLLLHLLALACVVLAIGRPAWRTAGGLGDRVVLLIDASASMGARDMPGGLSRFDRAKSLARELVEEVSRRSGAWQVAVMRVASESRLETGLTSSRRVALDAIDAMELSDQPGEIQPAWRLLQAMMSDEDESRHVSLTGVLISDGGFRLPLPPSPTSIRFERIAPAAPSSNAGIVALASERDGNDPMTVRVFADVLFAGPNPSPRVLSISIAGSEPLRRAVDAPTPHADGSPAHASVRFDLRATSGGLLSAELGPPDDFETDDHAALILPSAQRPVIWLVSPDSETEKRPAGAWLLSDALKEMNAREVRPMTATQFNQRLGQGSWQEADLIIFDRVTPLRTPPRPTISFDSVPPGIGVTSSGDAGNANVIFWKRDDPILRGISLDAVVASHALTLHIGADAPATTLADGPSSPLLLVAGAADARHIVVGFDLSESNWPVQASFPVFLAQAIDTLTLQGESGAGISFRTDQVVSMRARAAGDIRVSGPVVDTESPASTNDKAPIPEIIIQSMQPGILHAGPFPKAGVYRCTGAAASLPASEIAVNLFDENESSLATPENPLKATSNSTPAAVAAAISPREVWHWFVLGALGLLCIEWLVYARAVRT